MEVECDAVKWKEDAVTLGDGRQLAFVDIGDPNDKPLFWFHGLPGGRWQIPPPAPVAAQAHGFRIICVARPGVGGSSPYHRASLLSFAEDIGDLADALGIDRYAVAALSAGAPYALACAYRAPERVVAAALLGGVVPLAGDSGRSPVGSRVLSTILRRLKPGYRYLAAGLDLATPLNARIAPALFALYCRLGPRSDRPVLNRPDMHAMFGEDFVRVAREGVSGFLYDAANLGTSWGFDPREVVVPVRVWHGDIDALVRLDEAAHLASNLTHGKLIILPGLGHYAGLVKADEVIADLANVWASRDQAAPN